MSPPNASGNLLERALTLHRNGHPEDAEPLYRQVIFRDKRNHQALFSLSALLFEAGRLEEAIGYLEKASALRPQEARYLSNLGEAYRRTGHAARAVATFERILTLEPDFVEAHQNLGVTLMGAGELEAALPHLARAAELRPTDPILHVSLAWLLLRLRRPTESLMRAPTRHRARSFSGVRPPPTGGGAGCRGRFERGRRQLPAHAQPRANEPPGA